MLPDSRSPVGREDERKLGINGRFETEEGTDNRSGKSGSRGRQEEIERTARLCEPEAARLRGRDDTARWELVRPR